jgi:hypothetical protein
MRCNSMPETFFDDRLIYPWKFFHHKMNYNSKNGNIYELVFALISVGMHSLGSCLKNEIILS